MRHCKNRDEADGPLSDTAQTPAFGDPDPLSFTSSGDALAAKIDYAYTKDLVRALPSVEGNCALILWYTDPDYAFYDMEAIHMLKPRMVLIAYEANFTASSLLVQAWLRSLGLSGDSAYPTEMLPGPERWFPPKGEYSVSFQRDSALKDKYGCARNRIVLLSRNVTQQPWTEANFTLFEQEFYEDISSQELLKKLINRRI